MTAQHTPGPWHINTAGSAKRGEAFKITELYVYAPLTQDDTAICADVIDPVTQEPSEANARLIAAAPDLLAACRALVETFELADMGDEPEDGEYGDGKRISRRLSRRCLARELRRDPEDA